MIGHRTDISGHREFKLWQHRLPACVYLIKWLHYDQQKDQFVYIYRYESSTRITVFEFPCLFQIQRKPTGESRAFELVCEGSSGVLGKKDPETRSRYGPEIMELEREKRGRLYKWLAPHPKICAVWFFKCRLHLIVGKFQFLTLDVSGWLQCYS